MIELVDRGTGFPGGKLYSIVINGNRYDLTTTNTYTLIQSVNFLQIILAQ